MKLLIAVFLFILPMCSTSQTLAENKVDEFTKNTVKRTEFERLLLSNKMTLYARISKINENEFLDLRLMPGSGGGEVLSIREDDLIMIMLQNDSIISLKPEKYYITCRGCGAKGILGSSAEGIAPTYFITAIQHTALKSSPVKKIRIYTSKGYIEDELKEKKSGLLAQMLSLVE